MQNSMDDPHNGEVLASSDILGHNTEIHNFGICLHIQCMCNYMFIVVMFTAMCESVQSRRYFETEVVHTWSIASTKQHTTQTQPEQGVKVMVRKAEKIYVA
jgi:hypothetical protein